MTGKGLLVVVLVAVAGVFAKSTFDRAPAAATTDTSATVTTTTPTSSSTATIFFIRAMDPGVGLTPTIPLFMVGMATYWVCLQMLLVMRRARTLQGQSHAWEPTVDPHAFKTCSDAMKSFALQAEGSMLPECAFGVALGLVILYLSPLRLGSLEGRTFECSLCFSLVLTLTLVAAWRAHSLWHRLRDFTRRGRASSRCSATRSIRSSPRRRSRARASCPWESSSSSRCACCWASSAIPC